MSFWGEYSVFENAFCGSNLVSRTFNHGLSWLHGHCTSLPSGRVRASHQYTICCRHFHRAEYGGRKSYHFLVGLFALPWLSQPGLVLSPDTLGSPGIVLHQFNLTGGWGEDESQGTGRLAADYGSSGRLEGDSPCAAPGLCSASRLLCAWGVHSPDLQFREGSKPPSNFLRKCTARLLCGDGE